MSRRRVSGNIFTSLADEFKLLQGINRLIIAEPKIRRCTAKTGASIPPTPSHTPPPRFATWPSCLCNSGLSFDYASVCCRCYRFLIQRTGFSFSLNFAPTAALGAGKPCSYSASIVNRKSLRTNTRPYFRSTNIK